MRDDGVSAIFFKGFSSNVVLLFQHDDSGGHYAVGDELADQWAVGRAGGRNFDDKFFAPSEG